MAKPNSKDTSMVADRETKRENIDAPDKAYAIRPKVVHKEKPKKIDRLQELVTYLLSVGSQEFTGYIKINYTQGSIGRVERFEEILKK